MSIVLKYAEHSGRLGNIAFLVRFTMGAIDRLEQNLPKEESYIKAKEKIVEAFHMIVESLVDPPQVDSKKIGADVDKALIAAQPSRNLIHNLCLVMLVTQTEIFIEHLVDVILSTDSRRLKDLAGEKNLTTVELVDLQDYGAVMKRLREKVSKEITASSTQDMFIKHLGKRFGLFRKEDLVFKRPHMTLNRYGPQDTRSFMKVSFSQVKLFSTTRLVGVFGWKHFSASKQEKNMA